MRERTQWGWVVSDVRDKKRKYNINFILILIYISIIKGWNLGLFLEERRRSFSWNMDIFRLFLEKEGQEVS